MGVACTAHHLFGAVNFDFCRWLDGIADGNSAGFPHGKHRSIERSAVGLSMRKSANYYI